VGANGLGVSRGEGSGHLGMQSLSKLTRVNRSSIQFKGFLGQDGGLGGGGGGGGGGRCLRANFLSERIFVVKKKKKS